LKTREVPTVIDDGVFGTRLAEKSQHDRCSWNCPMRSLAAVTISMLLVGCAGVPVVPPGLKDKVDWNVSFLQVKAAPLSYKGRMIVVGGMVLTVKPLKPNGTRIEMLELPLDDSYEPTGRLTDSHGRFFAFHKEFIDPATVPIGTRITVVGEITGSITLQVDEVDYTYPTFDVQSMTVWSARVPALWGRPYPYFGA
jgi:outer membrane lipoprotein